MEDQIHVDGPLGCLVCRLSGVRCTKVMMLCPPVHVSPLEIVGVVLCDMYRIQVRNQYTTGQYKLCDHRHE